MRESIALERLDMRRSAVATPHPAAAAAARNILMHGGSAIDAAVGAMLVCCVATPGAVGLGGYGGSLVCISRRLTRLSPSISIPVRHWPTDLSFLSNLQSDTSEGTCRLRYQRLWQVWHCAHAMARSRGPPYHSRRLSWLQWEYR